MTLKLYAVIKERDHRSDIYEIYRKKENAELAAIRLNKDQGAFAKFNVEELETEDD